MRPNVEPPAEAPAPSGWEATWPRWLGAAAGLGAGGLTAAQGQRDPTVLVIVAALAGLLTWNAARWFRGLAHNLHDVRTERGPRARAGIAIGALVGLSQAPMRVPTTRGELSAALFAVLGVLGAAALGGAIGRRFDPPPPRDPE